jgi:hypothetical protein
MKDDILLSLMKYARERAATGPATRRAITRPSPEGGPAPGCRATWAEVPTPPVYSLRQC